MDKSSSNDKQMELLSEEINQLIAKREVEMALEKIERLLNLANKIDSNLYLGKAYAYKGFIFYGMNETNKAINFFETSLSHLNQNENENFINIIQVCNSLGALYRKMRELKKAVETYFYSVQISEKYNIKNSTVYNNIALIYIDQQDFKRALEYYQLAINIENESSQINKKKIVNYLSNMASLYFRLKDYEQAKLIYNKTFLYCKKNNEIELFIQSLKGLGVILLEQNKLSTAEEYFKKAINLSIEINFKIDLIDLNLYLSHVYAKTNRKKEQLICLKDALVIAKENFQSKEIIVLEELHDYYFNSREIQKAYETLKDIYINNNKAIQKEKEDKILELQEKFETEQKDKLIKQEQAFNQTLQEKNRELAALNEDLAQFNYGVSHDLKEPIRLVRGRLSHMHTKSIHKLNEEEQSSLETSLAAAERMERMLEDLHKFSSLGTQLKNQQQVNLNEVLAIVQADLQERIRANQAFIEVEKLPILLGYKNMFVQLFQNLINNALKFRRLEVAPNIKISYKTDEDWHIIHVQDNGVGIKKENQEQVFKLFKRLQETEAREGSGVGLSIVQKIVKKMQGEISLASVYGTGTCFILKFPKK